MSDEENGGPYTMTEDGLTGSTDDERLFAMLIYLSSLFTTFIGPILIWLIKREESGYVDFHGKEYLNFIISYTIYGIASGVILVFGIILTFIPIIGFIILGLATLVLSLIGLTVLILTIVAAIKAYNGERYRIPLVFRLIK
ncbi:MAG TPA: DUF4870 domain-containing protein [Pseudogracilibacillus sp.]|nr:DUF4870 domain-containing protein [Pseudogracilibacillus sp.]